ncbi:PQQ-dependent sugar dehydrogenase [Pseudohalioglobus sediminis]|uniref:PQQ-dependent sugar dehydrogenase n=1 Tax=Pseudohalioglobus sediminis TaxID=2606449 RepID=A0A5B0WXQ1_9GAMM|nr:PQQ-dependent sugar dehydrogenase [Pseudohalioglobus sediminis]KAA1191874.1 PQQ-dependent sugar dehydrogenase [Pseudohalioglobus sediminis]
MRTRCFYLLLLILAAPVATANSYSLTTVAAGIPYPWSIAFLPDGRYLVTSRQGSLHIVSADGRVGPALANTPETYFAGQGGYFDVVLDPEFGNNRTIYLSFAHGQPENNATRVIRATLEDDRLADVTPIFTAATPKATPQHYGGRLLLMSDGTLLLTTGDGFDYREQAQDTFGHLGKVIRINRDGSVPADNPFADGRDGDPKVYAYGLRNPQGLALDATSGDIYLHEHGPKGGDELNRVTPGSNFGWPVTSYGVNYSGARVSPFTTHPGITDPLFYWVPSIAPSGLAIYRGRAFPAWRGDLFIGALVDREVRRLQMEQGQVVAQESLFSELDERIRDVREGPQGALYLLTDGDSGKIIRVTPDR